MMKKIVFIACMLIASMGVNAAQVSVKYQKGLEKFASHMKSNLEQSNKNFNGKLELEVFCSYGKVKYVNISRSTGGGQSRYVPDYMYQKYGNPCK